MAKRMSSLLAVLGLITVSLIAQSKPSIQGVWQAVERTTTGQNASTNKKPQPSLYIFTAKHYSMVRVNGENLAQSSKGFPRLQLQS